MVQHAAGQPQAGEGTTRRSNYAMAKGRKKTHHRNMYFGVNTTAPNYTPRKREHVEAGDIEDIALSENGGFHSRPGRTRGNNGSPLITTGHSIFWFVDDANVEHLLIGVSGNIYDDGDAAGTPALSYAGLTADQRAYCAAFKGFFWYANGTDAPIKFDGNIDDGWTPVGTTAPAAAPVVTDLAVAGNLDGTYLYRYCYVYKNAGLSYGSESAQSARTAEITVANSKIQVDVIASGEAHVDNIRIFRSSTTSTKWHLLIELANSTASYTDNIADTTIVDNRAIDSIHEGKPEANLGGIAMWRNRLWGWYGRKLYWTKENIPEKWWSASSKGTIPESVDDDEAEPIKFIFPYRNALIIWTTTKVYGMFGMNEENFHLELIEENIGLLGPRTVQACGAVLYFLTRDGVYEYDGVSINHVSRWIDEDFHGYNRGILDASNSGLALSASFWLGNRKQYWLSPPTANGVQNDHTFVDFFRMHKMSRKADISPWSRYSMGFVAACVTPDNRVFTLDADAEYYHREAHGVKDDGVEFASYYETRYWNFDSIGAEKRGLMIAAVGNSIGPNILFTYQTRSGVSESFYLYPGSVGHWDIDLWDEFLWVEEGITSRYISLTQDFIDTYLGFKISATGTWGFEKFELEYTYEGKDKV